MEVVPKLVSKFGSIVLHRPRPETEDNRLYGSILWPTGVASTEQSVLNELAERFWMKRRDDTGAPLRIPYQWRSYYDVAEAHQWLYLGQPERTWRILSWFFDNQASPGLFSWSSGHHDGDTFYDWYRIRGWVRPPHVTPDYRTAAEMLLLQLAMLVYVDESGPEPILVVGGGVPTDWVSEPIEANGFVTSMGRVTWRWQSGVIQVTVFGDRRTGIVRLGPGFPKNARLQVTWRP